MSENKDRYMPVLKMIPFKEDDKKLELKSTETICNGVILSADIAAAGHFGNVVSLSIEVKSSEGWCCMFLPGYNHTKYIGFIVKALIDTIKDTTDDNTLLGSLKGCPVRLISNGNRLVGMGHYLNDKWLHEDAIIEWIKKNNPEGGEEK